MLKDKLTKAEVKAEIKWFNAKDEQQAQYKYFANVEHHLEFKRLRKEWGFTNTHKGEALLNIEALRLLLTKGNDNTSDQLEHIAGELKWNIKHIKGDK